MKKGLMTLLLLAAAFLLAVTPALAETAGAEDWVADNVDGTVWRSEDHYLEILSNGDAFEVLITCFNSDWEHTEWSYTCTYDAESGILTASYLVCDNVAFDESENSSPDRTNIIDSACEATFSLNEEGNIVLLNAADESLEGRIFIKVVYDDPEAAVG